MCRNLSGRNLSGTWSGKCAGTFPANLQEPFRHIWSSKCMCRNLSGKCAGTFPAHMEQQMCRNLSGKCAGTFPAHMERQMCRNLSGTYGAANVQEPFRQMCRNLSGTYGAANVQEPFRHMCRNLSSKCAGTFPAHMERQMCRNLSGTYGAPFSSIHAGIFPALQPKSCISGQVPQCWECYFSTFCIFNSTFVGIMFLQNSLESQFLFSFVGSILPTLLDVSINLARFNPHDFDLSHG